MNKKDIKEKVTYIYAQSYNVLCFNAETGDMIISVWDDLNFSDMKKGAFYCLKGSDPNISKLKSEIPNEIVRTETTMKQIYLVRDSIKSLSASNAKYVKSLEEIVSADSILLETLKEPRKFKTSIEFKNRLGQQIETENRLLRTFETEFPNLLINNKSGESQ